jgi:hypothetical protein
LSFEIATKLKHSVAVQLARLNRGNLCGNYLNLPEFNSDDTAAGRGQHDDRISNAAIDLALVSSLTDALLFYFKFCDPTHRSGTTASRSPPAVGMSLKIKFLEPTNPYAEALPSNERKKKLMAWDDKSFMLKYFWVFMMSVLRLRWLCSICITFHSTSLYSISVAI